MPHPSLLLKALVVSSVLASAATGAAQAPSNQDLVGAWNVTLTSPQGTHPSVFTIKDEAGQLAGSVALGPQTAPVAVKTSDSGVTLSFTVDYQGQPLPVVLSGKLADGALKGTVDYGSGAAAGDFEGRRAGAATGAAAATTTLTGTWTISSSGGSGWAMTLTQDGSAVTGTLTNAEGGVSLPLKGTLTSGALDLAVTGEASGTVRGTLDGNALKGTYDIDGNTGAWTATRKP